MFPGRAHNGTTPFRAYSNTPSFRNNQCKPFTDGFRAAFDPDTCPVNHPKLINPHCHA